MKQGMHRWAVPFASLCLAGCVLNSVHTLRARPLAPPDAAHALVVIGVGVEAPWPFAAFEVRLVEYSVARQRPTGNCVHFNRIEITRPPAPAAVEYVVLEVPANAYVFTEVPTFRLEPRSGRAFVAPPRGTVYFGDYVFAGDKTVAFRRDLEAARAATRTRLPHGAALEAADAAAAGNAPIPICTP